jgi:hypothetical protein
MPQTDSILLGLACIMEGSSAYTLRVWLRTVRCRPRQRDCAIKVSPGCFLIALTLETRSFRGPVQANRQVALDSHD